MSDFEKLKNELKDKLTKAQNSKEVEIVRLEIFGKNGFINSQFKTLGLLSPEDKKKDHKFYSGTGSYLPELVNAYFSAIEKFFISLPKKPNVVDLGCGDFVIGSKIRKLCNNYIAADIFDQLIDYNPECIINDNQRSG